MGMLFPRNDKEAKAATKKCKIPLVYVKSMGNRDGRPIYSRDQMADLGYKVCIDALTYLVNRMEGTPRQSVEVSGDAGPITTVYISAPRPGDIIDADGVVVLPAPTERQLSGP